MEHHLNTHTPYTESSDVYAGAPVELHTLLGKARRAYGGAIRTALAEEGMDDLPRRGDFILARISREGSPLSDLLRGGGITKQLGTQLMDTLVTRGYITRDADPVDRRRMKVTLTERGAAAADAINGAIADVDRELSAKVGTDQLEAARTVLAALAEIASEYGPGRGRGPGGGHGHGPRGEHREHHADRHRHGDHDSGSRDCAERRQRSEFARTPNQGGSVSYELRGRRDQPEPTESRPEPETRRGPGRGRHHHTHGSHLRPDTERRPHGRACGGTRRGMRTH